jgi:hypothetical protein
MGKAPEAEIPVEGGRPLRLGFYQQISLLPGFDGHNDIGEAPAHILPGLGF